MFTVILNIIELVEIDFLIFIFMLSFFNIARYYILL